MVGEAFAGLGAFKTMFDMTKALKDIHDVTIRDRAIIDLQKEILEAQAAQSELLHSVGELKKEVAAVKAWDTDKQRYELKSIEGGLVTYGLKPGMEGGEPEHYLCANCYSKNEKSILQPELRYPGACDVLTCHRCGSALYKTGSPDPEHFKNRRR